MGRKLQPEVDKIKEEWVKDRVKEILNKYKWMKWDMPPASMYGNAGRHDFIICQRGLFWTVETKAGKKEPTALQIGYAEDVLDAGGMSLLINEFNYNEVDAVASHVNLVGELPHNLAHDFTIYKARKPC